MTTSIGSSSTAHTSPLTSLMDDVNVNDTGARSSAGETATRKVPELPGKPFGPLGHNINTTA
jgi:hypothetical protein